MTHPHLFDDDDPTLARVRTMAFAFPGTAEKVSHGRPAFFTKKVFCYYGGAVRVDGVWTQHPHAIVVAADPDEFDVMATDDHFFVPAYLGPYGWIGLDIDDNTDWREVEELLDASYRLTGPAKLIAALDDSAVPQERGSVLPKRAKASPKRLR
jgi:predicted DNA-binding protein (MmcQ/YjbR family)